MTSPVETGGCEEVGIYSTSNEMRNESREVRKLRDRMK